MLSSKAVNAGSVILSNISSGNSFIKFLSILLICPDVNFAICVLLIPVSISLVNCPKTCILNLLKRSALIVLIACVLFIFFIKSGLLFK